jgi:hypothetical protein
MKTIPLTQAKIALVDDQDLVLVSKYIWHAAYDPSSGVYYAVTNPGCRRGRRQIRMHRLILGEPDNQIDHVDGDGLNNQRHNLRVATHSQNMQNRHAWGCSRFKGVKRSSNGKKWRATIYKDKKAINLGSFNIEVDAARAYDSKASELFGQFARLNFPSELCPHHAVRPSFSNAIYEDTSGIAPERGRPGPTCWQTDTAAA